ncbi:MAG: hypothetical protein ACRDT4_13575 [Micromonosporaceae bacterium]
MTEPAPPPVEARDAGRALAAGRGDAPPAMEVRVASQPGTEGAVNDDCAVSGPGFVAVLDGVTVPEGTRTGCVHGPAWYVRRLATALLAGDADNPGEPLPELLAGAIRTVRDSHGAGCDLDHPGTPQATVTLLRAAGPYADYLVLCDSPLLLRRGGRVEVVTDPRHTRVVEQLGAMPPGGTPARLRAQVEFQRRYANQPGGYWIAAADPGAARHAVTGRVPLSGADRLTDAALLTDGASCAVAYGLCDWAGLLDVLAGRGPYHLIALVRDAERSDPECRRWPRLKRHDDATAVYCRFS